MRLWELIRDEGRVIHWYKFACADDTLLYCEVATINDILHKSESLLEEASKWYEGHLLKLNINKT